MIAGLLLAGCAAQVAYRDGKDLVEQGKVEQGLSKLQEAIKDDPDNAEYRQAYLQTRDQAVYRYLEQADQFALAGKQAEAEQQYRQVLALDAGNERAREGLQQLASDARHRRLLEEGEAALAKKDLAEARLKLSTVLQEDPHNAAAAALRQAIDNKTTHTPADAALSAAYRKPVTIEFKDVALKQVFDVLSRTSGLNFLFDKDVKLDQKTSIFLKNSTVEAAVHFTLLTNQLEQQVLDHNTILIYPNTAAKQKDYQEMVVRSFFLSNTDAKSMANTLKTILKMRDIVVDDKLNMLIVRDSPAAIKLAEKLVAVQDIPEPEVMLEVEILEVNRTRLTDLGVQWPSSLALTPLSTSTGGTLTLHDLHHLGPSTVGASVGPMTINANTQDGGANLLANPRIRVRNHEKAKILIGERVPNITTTATSTGFISESINYVDVGLKLDVEPTVYLDDSVAIKIGLEVSSVTDQIKTQSGSVAYQIGTRTANTVLRLKDGENQVLAGLLNNEERSNGNKVPGLGDVPVLGRLFGSTTDNNQKTEIVLSITPHLIRNIRVPDAALSEFSSGTESSFRLGPQGFDAAPVAPSLPPPAPSPAESLKTNVSLNGPSAGASPATDPLTPNTAMTGNAMDPVNNGGAPVAANAFLQWQGPTQVKVGDTFNLQLMMQSNQPVTSVPATVTFDNHALQVVGISEGVFLKQGGAQTTFNSKLDPSGQIQLNDTRSGNGGATSLGNLATLTFRALTSSDEARVQLTAATPTGTSGVTIPASLPAPFSVQVQQ